MASASSTVGTVGADDCGSVFQGQLAKHATSRAATAPSLEAFPETCAMEDFLMSIASLPHLIFCQFVLDAIAVCVVLIGVVIIYCGIDVVDIPC